MSYDPSRVEPKWQDHWQRHSTFAVEVDYAKDKYYVLDMFPYPSGAGLHVGHPEGYTATDIIARYKRMRGYNVLHPMGWDAYGLPAERYAMRTGVHPAITTKQNIANFRSQIERLGFSYDWSRELSTTDPSFVRWTQWIFLRLYERGLAYEAEIPVNWCPSQGTVLANEEVRDGRYVETGDLVERRLMRQWMLRITEYADRLLEDLDELDWPEGIKAMQRNWIGRSHGAEIHLKIEGVQKELAIFTTRPETLWGATFCVVSTEHPLLSAITTKEHKHEVAVYVAESAKLTEVQRAEVGKEKTGLFTGRYAINPATNERIPIWVADYVIMSYGSGAIMAVPAHDARDHEFALRHRLQIIGVISPGSGFNFIAEPWLGEGEMIASPPLDGLTSTEAKIRAIHWLEGNGVGVARVHYRLRDWLFSRQRYWGEPIPIIHRSDGAVIPLPDNALPLLPPELDDYKPTEDGSPPLARAEEWIHTSDPESGLKAIRETNTMPQWAGSCWYYLRFIDPRNSSSLIDKDKERYWMPVDLYVGGAEHAVLHLLYARFWHKVLYDVGAVSTKEPFKKLFNQGMILSFSYRDRRGKYYDPSRVSLRDSRYYAGTEELTQQIEKMSKSRFNVVNPDEVIEEYGADSVRLYEMFMGPLDVTKPWQTAGVAGVHRFLHRTWRLICNEQDELDQDRVCDAVPDIELASKVHQTIRAVTEDIENLSFNTAISRLMELVNILTPRRVIPRSVAETFVLLLSPFAPHIAEELWSILGNDCTLAYEPWPEFDARLAIEKRTEYVVQINGKRRHMLNAEPDLDRRALLPIVMADEKVRQMLRGATILKEIVVPGKLVNFVVSTKASS